MTKGVFLMAFAKRGYAYSAYNLAKSIKFYSPDMPITLMHDDTIEKWLGQKMEAFDTTIPIPESLKFDSYGRYYPAQIKIGVYDFLPYDYNLFLDVDALAMQDLNIMLDELIKNGDYYNTTLFAEHSYKLQGREIPAMKWAYADDIWQKYKLDDDAALPCINSSFQFIKKCDQAKALFDQAKNNLSDPIPLAKLRQQWGGSQPDELYLNIAMCQKGINGRSPKEYIYFTASIDSRSPYDLKKEYPLLGLFGNSKMIRPRYTQFYDKEMIVILRNWGLNHHYKFNYIRADKHANTRPKQTIVRDLRSIKLEPSKTPIASTVRIDSSRLIQSYSDERGRLIKPTNYFNCSFIEFNNKKLLAYRMEAQPFCERMKIGLVELDESLQPIASTNSLLELHSDLTINFLRSGTKKTVKYPTGFHVEDPRLFIHNNELFLSYTDGYQMLQAKIDADKLTASDSFYIDKPVAGRTEKNWVFFSHDNKLYSVYDINRQVIFEMNGDKHTKAFYHDKWHDWQHGELRGGTSPVRVGDHYLSFFHSAIDIRYNTNPGRQYFMGAYMFEAKPPFTPVAISREPLLAGERISDSIPRLSNRIFVVFPSGVIKKDNNYLVSFGYNDLECRYVEITEEQLIENLTEVNQLQHA